MVHLDISAGLPEHLLALTSCLLGGRGFPRLCLDLEELELLLLSLRFLHILLHRFVQAGFAPEEQTFQGIFGWTLLRHLHWAMSPRAGDVSLAFTQLTSTFPRMIRPLKADESSRGAEKTKQNCTDGTCWQMTAAPTASFSGRQVELRCGDTPLSSNTHHPDNLPLPRPGFLMTPDALPNYAIQ